MRGFLFTAGLAGVIFLTAGCNGPGGPTAEFRLLPRDSLQRPHPYAMTADYRVVYRAEREGRVVTCAEPSPDMARIVSATANMGLDASAKGLEKVEPTVALTLAAARSESMTQLGQRLATIQLLRDSTYRACEAYANGAISGATYAMIVSRYDDVMVTLLLGEMAAGGAQAATSARLLGALSQSGGSAATLDMFMRQAQARKEAADADAAAARLAKKEAESAPDDDANKQAAIAAAAANVAAAEKIAAREDAIVHKTLDIIAKTRVELAASDGPTAQNPRPEGAPQQEAGTLLLKMQSNYLNDYNLDAITVGCLSALSQLDWPGVARAGRDMPADHLDNFYKAVGGPSATENLVEARTPSTGQSAGEQEAKMAQMRELGQTHEAFLSSRRGGAWSLQDECRATLRNGQVLRAAAMGRIGKHLQNTSADKDGGQQ